MVSAESEVIITVGKWKRYHSLIQGKSNKTYKLSLSSVTQQAYKRHLVSSEMLPEKCLWANPYRLQKVTLKSTKLVKPQKFWKGCVEHSLMRDPRSENMAWIGNLNGNKGEQSIRHCIILYFGVFEAGSKPMKIFYKHLSKKYVLT